MNEVKRSVRVAERLRQEVALGLRGLRDPRIAGAFVTRVELTDDLQLARVHVRLEHDADAQAKKKLLMGLGAATSRLRRDAGRALGLRYTPDLRFFYDDGQDAAARVEELLREIHRGEDRDGGDEGGGVT